MIQVFFSIKNGPCWLTILFILGLRLQVLLCRYAYIIKKRRQVKDEKSDGDVLEDMVKRIVKKSYDKCLIEDL